MDTVLEFLKNNGPAILNWAAWLIGVAVALLTVVKAWRQGTSKSIGDLITGIVNAFASAKPPTDKIVKLVPFALVGMLAVGCASPYQKMLDTIQGATIETIKETAKGGFGQYQGGAQVINPGYDVEVGILARCSVKMTGIAGQIQASGQGSRTPLTEQEAATTDHVIRDTSIANQDKRDMLKGVGRAIVGGASAINEDVRDAAGLNGKTLSDQTILVMCYRVMLNDGLSIENRRATCGYFAIMTSPEVQKEIFAALDQTFGKEPVGPPNPTSAPPQ